MSSVASPTVAPRQSAGYIHHTRKYAFIDALRGYAVLLVITCHTGEMFPLLPDPLKKLTNFGWHGVQLFFLVSCVTLMLSWRSDEAKGRASAADFWIRRLFRIAPMYFLAGALYFVIEPPPGGFDLAQLVATLAFVNTWHPFLIPTVPHRWMVVPGGWSIGVEFTFYLLFPLIARAVRSMRAAVLFLLLALLIGCVANDLAAPVLRSCCGPVAITNFLYFWFPNQLSVFALGTILFFALVKTWADPTQGLSAVLRRYGTALFVACGAACLLVANLSLQHNLTFAPPTLPPAFLVASAIFLVAALALACPPHSLFVNRATCSLGQVSFSAYLLHFGVLHKLPMLLPSVFDVGATGWRAIVTCFALWAVAVPTTYTLSAATFRFIETPMIALGRRVLVARHQRRIARSPLGREPDPKAGGRLGRSPAEMQD